VLVLQEFLDIWSKQFSERLVAASEVNGCPAKLVFQGIAGAFLQEKLDGLSILASSGVLSVKSRHERIVEGSHTLVVLEVHVDARLAVVKEYTILVFEYSKQELEEGSTVTHLHTVLKDRTLGLSSLVRLKEWYQMTEELVGFLVFVDHLLAHSHMLVKDADDHVRLVTFGLTRASERLSKVKEFWDLLTFRVDFLHVGQRKILKLGVCQNSMEMSHQIVEVFKVREVVTHAQQRQWRCLMLCSACLLEPGMDLSLGHLQKKASKCDDIAFEGDRVKEVVASEVTGAYVELVLGCQDVHHLKRSLKLGRVLFQFTFSEVAQ